MGNSIHLKPCPFCGGEARIFGGQVGCRNLSCRGSFRFSSNYDGEDVAVDAWNQRKRSEVLTESMIETIENPKQTLDNMDDPLEPIKVVSAMKSQSMVLTYRQEHEPDKVSILDYTVIAALWKQIPHKVEVTKWMTYPERVPFGICPGCGEDVDGTKRYCDRCGQALMWQQEGDDGD